MTLSAATTTTLANSREAIATLGSKARRLRDASLPLAASGAESGGKAISAFALSTSTALARSLRGERGIAANGLALLQAAPLLRMAGRFALRNPALLAAAGVAIVVLGHSAWKRRQSEADASAVPAE